jgi:hypothetical protein
MLPDDEIKIEFDEEYGFFYIIWRPVIAIGMGETEKGALEDLREAANFGVETAVNLKLAEIG